MRQWIRCHIFGAHSWVTDYTASKGDQLLVVSECKHCGERDYATSL